MISQQLNTVFGDEKMQQPKRETPELEISSRKRNLALKQWDQIQTGMKDASRQSESLGDNAPAACRKMLQKDLQNCMTKNDELGKILGHHS